MTNNPAYATRSAANDKKNVFAFALAENTLVEEHAKRVTSYKEEVNDKITAAALATLKRRLIYSHLLNTADRVSWASEQLYGLSVKYY